MAFVILSGGIDLSVGSTAAVASILAAKLSGEFALVTVLVPILVGIGIGAVNGLLVTRLGIAPFIATLATMLGARGLAFIIAGKDAIVVGDSTGWFSQVARGSIVGIPFLALIFALALGVAVIAISPKGKTTPEICSTQPTTVARMNARGDSKRRGMNAAASPTPTTKAR